MKLLRVLAVFLLMIGLLVLGLFISGNQYLLKGVWATYLHGERSATITDKKYFTTRIVESGEHQAWPRSKNYNRKQLSSALRDMLEQTESIAFVVIRNDSLAHEEYWQGFSDSSRTNSFSMAKSVTTLLTQIAIQEGYFKGWDDKVANYLPGLEGAYRGELTLAHLSTMTAGLRWNEDYHSPFDITAKAYYGPNIGKLMLSQVPVVNKPGEKFEYQSGATQLLGLALAKTTGKTLSQYASEKLWVPLGARYPAEWHLDSRDGTELNYCCMNSNALDFARFGKLLIHHGKWEGEPLIDSAFIARATKAQLKDFYGYSFWIDTDDHLTPVYYMRGILGQYVIVIPEKDLVICRLGKQWLGYENDKHHQDFHIIVSEVLKYF